MIYPTQAALEQRAVLLFPDSEVLQHKWLAAVAYLRAKKRWALDGAPVSWRS